MMTAQNYSSLEDDAFARISNKTGIKEKVAPTHKYLNKNTECTNNISHYYTHNVDSPSMTITDPVIKKELKKESLSTIKTNIIQTNEKEEMWWVGLVTEVDSESFSASLEDLQGRINFVEFETHILDGQIKNELKIGARFTYTVSSIEKYTGGKKYIPKLNFVTQANWCHEYESRVQDVIDDILPDDLFNL